MLGVFQSGVWHITMRTAALLSKAAEGKTPLTIPHNMCPKHSMKNTPQNTPALKITVLTEDDFIAARCDGCGQYYNWLEADKAPFHPNRWICDRCWEKSQQRR